MKFDILAKSGERDALVGALGAGIGIIAIPHMPQFAGKWTNLAVGIAAVFAGIYLKHDGIGYALIGFGAILAIDGLVRVVFPQQTSGSAYFSPVAMVAGSGALPMASYNY